MTASGLERLPGLDGGTACPQPGLTATVLKSLSTLTDSQIERVTQDSPLHVDGHWLRMVDALGLDDLVGGQVALRFVAVTAGNELAALCPFIVTRSASVYSLYSFDKSYFTAWQDEFLNLYPERAAFARWIGRAVGVFKWFANATGAGTGGWVLGASPLNYHFDIAIAPGMAPWRAALHAKAVEVLKEVARDEDLPLGLLGVRDEQQALRVTLREQGFVELFSMYDNVIELPEGGFDQYLRRFSRHTRQSLKSEMRRVRDAGVAFDFVGDVEGLGGELEHLYETMYSRHATERLRHPADFWNCLARHLGDRVEFLLARRDGRLVGFTALLRKGDELIAWRAGRLVDGDLAQLPLYFSMGIYEPVQRALCTGARRLWLGAGCGSAKTHRGATPHAICTHLWFPRAWPRRLLTPYLQAFSAINRRDQSAAMGL